MNFNRYLRSPSAFKVLAMPVLLPIFLGYLSVLVSIVTGFEPDSSGAVLVGACIVANLLFERLLWRRAGQSYGHGLLKRVDEGNGTYFYSRGDDTMMISGFTREFDLLRKAGSDNDSRNGELWSISSSLDDFDRLIIWIIGASTVIGTLIWGYLGLIFDTCSC